MPPSQVCSSLPPPPSQPQQPAHSSAAVPPPSPSTPFSFFIHPTPATHSVAPWQDLGLDPPTSAKVFTTPQQPIFKVSLHASKFVRYVLCCCAVCSRPFNPHLICTSNCQCRIFASPLFLIDVLNFSSSPDHLPPFLFRVPISQATMSVVRPIAKSLQFVWTAFVAAVARLDKSLSPSQMIHRLHQHSFTLSDYIYTSFIVCLFTFWLYLMQVPGFPTKLLIPILYISALSVPLTAQFFIPATPIFAWLLTFYSSRYIPVSWRPNVSVVLLPTLESVLYGANISDILTRYTHPFLDILAWIPYGVGHFMLPFIVAAFLWLFRPKQALHQWARIFGWLNFIGVVIQILLPCAPPWYEVIYGLAPATYAVRGSAA